MSGYLLLTMFSFYAKAGVAQLAEHQPSKLRVAGSIPVSRSITSTLRLPGLKARACSGLTLSGASLPRLQRGGLALSNGSRLYC